MLGRRRNICNQLRIIDRLCHNIIGAGGDLFLQPLHSFVQMLHVRVKRSPDHKLGLLFERLAREGYPVIELLDHPDNFE
ncbi:hypothetical protein D3C80_1438750 [compost metagenome]